MPTINPWFLNEAVPALCRTLLHSLWQGLVISLLAGLVLLTSKKTAAAVRYKCFLLLLCGAVLWVAYTFVQELGSGDTPVSRVDHAMTIPKDSELFPNFILSPAVDTNLSASDNFLSTVNRYSVAIVGTWFFFFLLHLLRLATGLRSIHQMKRQRVHAPSPSWTLWIHEQCHLLGISQRVTLLESEIINIPAVMGIVKPVVLVPMGLLTGLNPSQVEVILLHELAHIKRKDYLVNILQSVVDAVFFFNPAITWLSSLVRQERESCCDEMVLDRSTNAENYIEALLSFQQIRGGTTYAMALNSGKGALLQRVRRILTKENNALSKKEVAGLLLGVMVSCFCLLAFRNKEKEPVQKVEYTKPVYTRQSPATVNPIRSTSVIAKAKKDTVPPVNKIADKKIKFKEVTINQVDNGEGKTEQTIATDEEGTQYRVRKEGSIIKQLEVNGKVISPDAYPAYYPVLDALEQRRVYQLNKQQQLQEKQQKVLHEKKQALAKQLSKLDEQRIQQKQEIQARQQKLQEKQVYAQALKLDSLQQANRSFKSLNAYHENKFKQINKANISNRANKVHTGMDPVLTAILQDLKAQGMVENETKFSFSLREGELMINGKVQPQSTYEVFQKKYLKSSGDRFSYFRDGGTTRTEVHIQ